MGWMDFLKRKRAEADAVNSQMITLGRCGGGCEGCSCAAPEDKASAMASVRVLGPAGDASRLLYANARQAVDAAGLQIMVEHISDMAQVVRYGVMPLPALVVDDQVVSAGRELTVEEIGAYLQP